MRGKRIRTTAAVAACVLAGVATACGGEDESTGGGDPVKVGGIFDLSGPTADVGTPYANGIKGFVKYWKEQGRRPEIVLTSEDYAYDVPAAERLYASLREEGVVAVQGWGTKDTVTLRARVTADRVPFMSASLAEDLTEPSQAPFNFVAATSYSDQMRIAMRWISEQARGAEVASFHEKTAFGKSPQTAGKQTAKELGLGFKPYKMEDPEDYVSQLRDARSLGATFAVIQNVSTPAANLVRKIAEHTPHMKVVCLNWCADERFIEIAGAAAEGTVAVMPFAPTNVAAEGLAHPRKFLSLRGRALDQEGLHYVQGWYTMALMAEGIELAADKGEVTGESIKQALEEIDAFDTGGVSAPIDFTAESHAGMKESRLYVVKNEQWSELTELQKAK